jgi:hypothetical protein
MIKTVGLGISIVLLAWGLLRSITGRRRGDAGQGR